MAPYRIAVVIPAYNEQERLPPTLARMAAARTPGFELVKIYVAENGSNDDTLAVAIAQGARLGLPLVAEHRWVTGKARALAVSIPEAVGGVEGVLFMDADNATDLGELRHFDPTDRTSIQIASRALPSSVVITANGRNRPLSRRILATGMRILARRLLGLPERDSQCGFKLFPVETVSPLFGALRSSGWVFDAEILARAHRAGLSVREIPVRWTEMPGSSVRPVRDGLVSVLGLFKIWWYLRASSRSR